MKHEALDELFEIDDVLNHTPKSDALFLEAMKEAFHFHYAHNEVYKNICDDENFNIDAVKSIDDLSSIPHFLVDIFKWYSLLSIPEKDIEFTFTSSGTSGQKSHISWDKGSHERQTIMRQKIMQSYDLVSEEAVNYMIFAYAPEVSDSKGAAYAHQMYASFAPTNKKFFAIHADENKKPIFDAVESFKKLEEFSKDSVALRIIGFPAFIYQTLSYMKENSIKLKFNENSLIIIAGGWKNMANDAISPKEFATLCDELLGIDSSKIRDIYGFVEHGVPYITCESGHFHVPIYSRIFAREPGSLRVLGEGEKGLLQVLSPYNYAQPALSILATDYVKVHSKCSCGRDGQYIELLGRAGLKKHQGCAITATELLKK